eukprot:7026160-Prymnesium_polylepis.1
MRYRHCIIGRPPHVKPWQHSRRLPERRCGSHSDHHRYTTNSHATCTTETANSVLESHGISNGGTAAGRQEFLDDLAARIPSCRCARAERVT